MHQHHYATARSNPSQARGKERVRRILSAALGLFAERGLEVVTTNDIAKAAGIPIGSLYRYYPNKEAVIAALANIYTSDLAAVFTTIAKHPLLKGMSWHEVVFLTVDTWVQYARLNGTFAFLYAVSSNPRLLAQNKEAWETFVGSFDALINKRCPYMGQNERLLCFRFCMTAAEMGINDTAQDMAGSYLYYEAVGVIAAYMLKSCQHHMHEE
jgi:AcrR family transcriptional regulator